MSSDQENSQNLKPSTNPVIKSNVPVTPLQRVTQILPEESPLAYIQRQLQNVTDSPETINNSVNQILEEKNPNNVAPSSESSSDALPKDSSETSSTDNSSLKETDPLDNLELDSDTTPEEEAPKDSEKLTLADNFKRLRKNHTETKQQLAQISKEKEELEKKVTDLNTGTATPEVIQQYEDRIQELSYWQKLHNFRASEEYQELSRPLEVATARLTELAKEYEIPENVLNSALNITSRRELNEFLSEHFDVVGAQEAKGLVDSIKESQAKLQEAEKKPAEALTELQEQQRAARQIRDTERKQKIKSRSQDAWVKALTNIRAQNKVKELIPTTENSEHNNNVVKPIITAAGTEYGKMVRMLAEAGLTELSPELAEALANAVLLGHASAVSVTQREEAVKYATDLQDTMQRHARFNRPGIGSSAKPSSTSPGQEPQPMTPSRAAESIAQQILNRRG